MANMKMVAGGAQAEEYYEGVCMMGRKGKKIFIVCLFFAFTIICEQILY